MSTTAVGWLTITENKHDSCVPVLDSKSMILSCSGAIQECNLQCWNKKSLQCRSSDLVRVTDESPHCFSAERKSGAMKKGGQRDSKISLSNMSFFHLQR